MTRPNKLRGVQFISYSDLARDVAAWAHKLPKDICAVVGIPRSGLTVAHMLAAELNIPAMQIHGREFRQETGRKLTRRAGRFLVVDDTASYGVAMQEARRQVANTPCYFGAVYVRPEARPAVDFWFKRHAEPDWLVVTQWNLGSHQDSKWIVFERGAIKSIHAPVAGVVDVPSSGLAEAYGRYPNAALLVTRSDADALRVAIETGRATLSSETWKTYAAEGVVVTAPLKQEHNGRTVTIIGKGPSAAQAAQWIAEGPPTDIASINEAALILPPQWPVRFCFFCHANMADKARLLWDRVETFVAPTELIGLPDLPEGFPAHKITRYIRNGHEATKEDVVATIRSGQPAHHQSVVIAMTWLAKLGYRRIRLIGCDGGTGYATGFAGEPAKIVVTHRPMEDLAVSVLKELYGCTVERFGE